MCGFEYLQMDCIGSGHIVGFVTSNSLIEMKDEGADNSFYRPAPAFLTVTDQNDFWHNVKTILPIINILILLENDQQLLSQS